MTSNTQQLEVRGSVVCHVSIFVMFVQQPVIRTGICFIQLFCTIICVHRKLSFACANFVYFAMIKSIITWNRTRITICYEQSIVNSRKKGTSNVSANRNFFQYCVIFSINAEIVSESALTTYLYPEELSINISLGNAPYSDLIRKTIQTCYIIYSM
jgi:hypothetical protein